MAKTTFRHEPRHRYARMHPYTNLKRHETDGPLVITEGDGVFVRGEDGKMYLEGLAGLWNASLGFSERRLAEAAYRQMLKLPFYHTFAHKAVDIGIELAEKLLSIAPAPMSKVFFVNSGSEANDTIVKLVWYYNNAVGPSQKEENHQPLERLPWRDGGERQPDRLAEQSSRFRPAHRQYPACGMSALLSFRAARRNRGSVRQPDGRFAGTTHFERRRRTRWRPLLPSRSWARAECCYPPRPISIKSRLF